MRRFCGLLVLTAAFAAGSALAAGQTVDLVPGDSLEVRCPTLLLGQVGGTTSTIACATATPTPVPTATPAPGTRLTPTVVINPDNTVWLTVEGGNEVTKIELVAK